MWGEGSLLFCGYRVSDLQDKRVLEICFTTIRIYLTLLNCGLKMDKMVNFMLCFYYNLKKNFKKAGAILYKHSLNYCQIFKRRISGSMSIKKKKSHSSPITPS